jgi:hypothetical protein
VTPRRDLLEPELEALLAVEREARPPEVALDRVWSHLERSVGAAGAAKTSTDPPGGAGGASGWVGTHAPVLVALAFGVGAAAGATATVVLRKPAERIVYVDRPAPVAPSSREVAAAAPTGAPSAIDAAPQAPRPRSSVARAVPVPSSYSSLPAERALLDSAREALGQNDGARAIALTDEHARRFSRPQLGEEREAIGIQALVIEGRYDEARERARQFRAGSPDSLFLPAVEASLASIP